MFGVETLDVRLDTLLCPLSQFPHGYNGMVEEGLSH